MSQITYRVSGKTFTQETELPASAVVKNVTRRPGGWVCVEFEDGQRKRLMLAETKGKLSVAIGGMLLWGEVRTEGSYGGGAHAGSDSDLIAQFPGKVRKLLVGEGDRVSLGQVLVLVEAMKMEFAIKAPFAGRITQLLVSEGQQLTPGDRFLDLEELSETGDKE